MTINGRQGHTAFKPSREHFITRVPTNIVKNAFKMVAEPIAGVVNGAITGASAPILAGRLFESTCGLNGQTTTEDVAEYIADKDDIFKNAFCVAFVGLGFPIGLIGGAIIGGAAGLASSTIKAIGSLAKGIGNLFGRKTPDHNLLCKALQESGNLNELHPQTGYKIWSSRPLEIEDKQEIARWLKAYGKIEDVAKHLGADDGNMDAACDFIKRHLNISPGIYNSDLSLSPPPPEPPPPARIIAP